MKSNSEIYLGLDIGTTSVKAGLVSAEGLGLAQRSCEYPTYFPETGYAEQSADDWWHAACKAVRELSEAFPKETKQIKSVSISSQAPTMLPIDAKGNPLRNALIWMDQRAKEECAFLREYHADYIRRNMCNRIDPYYALPKLLWFKKNEPDRYRDTFTILQANGWLIYKLTGKFSVDESSAALTQVLNVHTMTIDTAFLEELDLDPKKWPSVYPCDATVGFVQKDAAAAWGIPEGIPVAAGCIDGASAPLGLGLTIPGNIFEMSGQSSGIGVILDRPVYHENLCLLRHATKNEWILKGSMSSSGGSLRWFRDTMDDKSTPFDEYNRLAEASPAGANGVIFLPYLAGERAPLWDSSLRGLFFGIGTYTTKADMVRAIMEGSAFALRTILDEFKAQHISHNAMIQGTGGGYASRIWSQIKSDILNTEICASEQVFDAAIIGNAILAAKSVDCELHPLINADNTVFYKPDPESNSLYEERYEFFKKVFRANRELFHER